MIILMFRDELESERLQDHTYGGDIVGPIIKRQVIERMVHTH